MVIQTQQRLEFRPVIANYFPDPKYGFSPAVMDGQEEGSEGFSALMWAVYGGHESVITKLLDKVTFFRGCFECRA